MTIALVFPARAGMIPRVSHGRGPCVGIPRESGDDPPGVPPRIRGRRYTPRSGDDTNKQGIITADGWYSPRERG